MLNNLHTVFLHKLDKYAIIYFTKHWRTQMKGKQNYSANGYTFTACSLRGAKQIASKAFWNGKIKGSGWLSSYVHLSCEGIEVSTYCTIGISHNWLNKE